MPLRNVNSLIDKNERRNLKIGFFEVYQTDMQPGQKTQQQYTTIEILLYFENESKCTYVKNMLDHTKKSFKDQQISKASGFFDKCLRSYGLKM